MKSSTIGPNNFDAMRFLAAVLVIFSHCFPLLFGTNEGTEPLFRLTQGKVTLGRIAVDVFFAISGFLITMSWERSSSWFAYLRKRVARIVPGYVCAMLLCMFVVAPLFETGGKPWISWSIARVSFRAMLHLREVVIEGVFANNPLSRTMNGSAWTISYEFKCYLAVLVCGVIGGLKYRWITLVVLAGTWVLRAASSSSSDWYDLAAFFAAGSAFYLYRIPLRDRWAAVSALLVLASLFIPVTLGYVLPVFGSYLLFWIVFQPHVTCHQFARYGDFSYGIYLYAFPIQQTLIALRPHFFSPWGLFAAATPLSILAGAISWHAVEKHFMRKKLSSNPRAAPPPGL